MDADFEIVGASAEKKPLLLVAQFEDSPNCKRASVVVVGANERELLMSACSMVRYGWQRFTGMKRMGSVK